MYFFQSSRTVAVLLVMNQESDQKTCTVHVFGANEIFSFRPVTEDAPKNVGKNGLDADSETFLLPIPW